ncbi:hypothetical protein [uncultured Mucilaginibacter sp.]|uniref:hypothetical protein n=1 Tax=uncultured Mucilaginibacter sp. TaxID=797541 RepID=UPI002608850F|nr:hypothetical protein [uncultured Mucilaginibacter sp.]
MLRLLPADLTLVINLSAGDVAYAYFTAGALIKAHRKTAKEVILILDDTQAQYSHFYDHQKRYKEPEFTAKLKTVSEIAQEFKHQGLVDQVIYMSNFTNINLNRKYLNNRVKETHDFRGAPITAYLAGFEICKTQYLVRYDGDMILHQPGKDWVLRGIELLKEYSDCVAVSPRPSPPDYNEKINLELDPTYWFSTRCTLFDKVKLMKTIPFLQGKFMVEVWLRKLFDKTYPPAFETILTDRLKNHGFKNYYLLTNGSWILHPEEKKESFIKLLPLIIAEVKKGNYPAEQVNNETLELKAWEKYLQLIET